MNDWITALVPLVVAVFVVAFSVWVGSIVRRDSIRAKQESDIAWLAKVDKWNQKS